MKAEYFAPREDVILQNEAPTDFYILVTGKVVSDTNILCRSMNYNFEFIFLVHQIQ